MQSSGFHALTLVEKTREFDEIYTFTFAPEVPIPFVPGQYAHLLAPASPPGRENIRHMSMASIPEEGNLKFTFDLGSGSAYKKAFAALQPGGKAHLFKVKGEFVLPESGSGPVVFVAGGLGITPVRALAGQIVRRSLPLEWSLIHVARGEHLYAEEMRSWGPDQRRIRRRDVPEAIAAAVRDRPGALWFVSGSARFVDGIRALLSAAGVPGSRVKTEDFS